MSSLLGRSARALGPLLLILAFTRDLAAQTFGVAVTPQGSTIASKTAHTTLKLTTSASYVSNVERWIGLDSVGRIDKHLNWQGNNGRFFQYDSLGRIRVASTKTDTQNPAPPGANCPEPNYGLIGECFIPTDWAVLGVPDTFAYDLVGNRTDKGGTYGTGNRIQTFSGCSYVTDNDGNVTSRTCGSTTATFTWNEEGQLTNVSITGQPTFAYYYDAAGRLVRRDSAGVANRYFLWDGDNLLAELGGSANTKIAEYSYYPGLDRLHALVIGATPYYAHNDGLGNVIQLSEATSSRRWYDYTEWGILKGGSDGLPFNGKDRARWKGALWMGQDSTLYYLRNRWYEAGTGRFLSEDPSGLRGGPNPSVFASNDPINLRDPLGLQCEPISILGPGSSSGDMDVWEFNYEWRVVGWACNYSERSTGFAAGFGVFAGAYLVGSGSAGIQITDWSRLGTHIIPIHVQNLRGWGAVFSDMDERALRHIISQTALEGRIVQTQPVRGEIHHRIERNWKSLIGTKGERAARVVVTSEGRLITAFPQRSFGQLVGTALRGAGRFAGGAVSIIIGLTIGVEPAY